MPEEIKRRDQVAEQGIDCIGNLDLERNSGRLELTAGRGSVKLFSLECK